MFLKLIQFVIFCLYFNVFRAKGETNTIYTTLIARQHLFMGEMFDVSIFNIVADESKTEFPIIMITVTVDKTLGYDIYPYFPHFIDKSPDLNAVATDQTFIQSPSMVTFQIDFTANTLTEISCSSMIHLYANRKSVVTGNGQNKTKQPIKISSKNIDGKLFYNLNFVLFIDSADLEGLYKVFLHSNEKISSAKSLSIASHNVEPIWYIMRTVAYLVLFCLASASYFQLYRDSTKRLDLLVAFWCVFLAFEKMLVSEMIYMYQGNVLAFFGLNFSIKNLEYVSLMWILMAVYLFWMEIKIFDIFVWAIIIHAAVQKTDISYMGHIFSFVTVAICQVLMLAAKRGKRMKWIYSWNNDQTRDRCDFVRNCLHLIYAVVLYFNLSLASMISLELPFHLFWIQIVIEEILYVLYWFYVVLPNIIYSVELNIDSESYWESIRRDEMQFEFSELGG